jgi:rRNA maturation endonuclease Nob1
MIIDAKQINGIIECKHEIHLECANCGSTVDAIEYKSGTCNDCGSPWDEIRHVAIHVTSVPATGQTL